MPVVPRRQQSVVSTQPLPGVRSQPGQFAAPPSVDIGPIARQVQDIFAKERDKADQVAVLDADNKLSELSIGLQSDALKMQGKDALNALPHVEDGWRQSAAKIENSLGNDRQRMEFARAASSRWASLHESVSRHTDNELQKYDAETTASALDNRLNDAIADPAKAPEKITETRAILGDYGGRHGLSPEVLKDKIDERVSKIHFGVLVGMTNSRQDLTAKQYFADHKDELKGSDLLQATKVVNEGSLRGESQRQADQILLAEGVTRSTALDAAKKLTDPEVRDATETRLNQHFNEQNAIDRETDDKNMLAATNIVEKTGTVDNIPPAMWSTFSISEREALKNYNKKLSKGTPVETDWGAYYFLQGMASSDAQKTKFMDMNLLQFRDKLGDTEFKQMVEVQSSLRKGDGKASAALGSFRTDGEIVKGSLVQAGVINAKTPNDDPKVTEFWRAVDVQRASQEAATGKKTTSDDVQQIVDRLLIKSVVLGSGDERRVYEVRPGEQLILRLRDVPPRDRAAIEAALQRNGQPLTEKNIIHTYRLYIDQTIRARGSAPAP